MYDSHSMAKSEGTYVAKVLRAQAVVHGRKYQNAGLISEYVLRQVVSDAVVLEMYGHVMTREFKPLNIAVDQLTWWVDEIPIHYGVRVRS